MIVSYYSIFLQKSILWLRCMYYSDESSRVIHFYKILHEFFCPWFLFFASLFCVLSDITINKILSEKEHHCNASNQTSNQSSYGPHRHGYRAAVFILAVHRWHAPDRTAHFSYDFSSYGPHSCSLRYAGINSVILWAITLLFFFFFRIIYL